MIRKGVSPRAAAADWVSEHEQALRLKADWPDSEWTTLCYERLCESPLHEALALCGFLGVRPDASILRFRNWSAHILGNRMRLSREDEIRPDTAWRTELTGHARVEVESVTAALNEHFGYA
jgi:hypothetical protein